VGKYDDVTFALNMSAVITVAASKGKRTISIGPVSVCPVGHILKWFTMGITDADSGHIGRRRRGKLEFTII